MRQMILSAAEDMQSAASTLFTAYSSLAGSMMLIRTMANDLVPSPVRTYLQSALHYFFTPVSDQITIVVDEYYGGISRNQVYDAAEVYLRTKISPDTGRFKVGKTQKQKSLNISVEKGEEIIDRFDDTLELKWRFTSVEPEKQNGYGYEKRFFELSFSKKYKDRVLNEYLPFVLAKAKEIKDNVDKVVKLYTRDGFYGEDDSYGGGGVWGSINLDHPSTFETLAMDPELKKAIIEDLDRFLKRKEFYKKVGKAWKRGYLLYGPPGTGKSSLIAAIANYLKFDIYDLELTKLPSNSELRRMLVSTTNRSIIVIEDIDCSVEMQDRKKGTEQPYGPPSKLTLSGLLNFIDGLWSSCGDERIIIFTTNYKDRLDHALLRPGRMDMHIHMSYCTVQGFRLLVSNYLDIHDHHMLFGEIEDLIANVKVTPAEVAEQLMKSEDANIALSGVVNFLKRKKMEGNEIESDKANGRQVLQEENELKVRKTKRLKIGNVRRNPVRNSKGRAIRGKKSER